MVSIMREDGRMKAGVEMDKEEIEWRSNSRKNYVMEIVTVTSKHGAGGK